MWALCGDPGFHLRTFGWPSMAPRFSGVSSLVALFRASPRCHYASKPPLVKKGGRRHGGEALKIYKFSRYFRGGYFNGYSTYIYRFCRECRRSSSSTPGVPHLARGHVYNRKEVLINFRLRETIFRLRLTEFPQGGAISDGLRNSVVAPSVVQNRDSHSKSHAK